MGSLDLAAALDRVPDATPAELTELVRAAASPLGITDISLYLVDFQGVCLEPVLLRRDLSEPVQAEEYVATSMAGRAFRTGQVVTAERAGAVRVWVPVLERGERTGVLALTVPTADDDLLGECERLGLFTGLLIRAFARTTDLLHLSRRSRPMTLAAGMQWDLLPPLVLRCAEASACGRLEPAYEIAGDAFDYALNNRHLDAAIFDGMGHGVSSTLMTTLAMGAYRHARRNGDPPLQARAAIDEALAAHYGGEAFVTAVLVRLALAAGTLEWANAGHPPPLLLRGQRVARELHCTPSLPLGLGDGEPAAVSTEHLEPGDAVLFFTDGVIEGRSPDGDEFGVDRLARLWEQHWTAGQRPEEVLRRVVEAIHQFNVGKLRDDATLLQLCWYGPHDPNMSRVDATRPA